MGSKNRYNNFGDRRKSGNRKTFIFIGIVIAFIFFLLYLRRGTNKHNDVIPIKHESSRFGSIRDNKPIADLPDPKGAPVDNSRHGDIKMGINTLKEKKITNSAQGSIKVNVGKNDIHKNKDDPKFEFNEDKRYNGIPNVIKDTHGKTNHMGELGVDESYKERKAAKRGQLIQEDKGPAPPIKQAPLNEPSKPLENFRRIQDSPLNRNDRRPPIVDSRDQVQPIYQQHQAQTGNQPYVPVHNVNRGQLETGGLESPIDQKAPLQMVNYQRQPPAPVHIPLVNQPPAPVANQNPPPINQQPVVSLNQLPLQQANPQPQLNVAVNQGQFQQNSYQQQNNPPIQQPNNPINQQNAWPNQQNAWPNQQQQNYPINQQLPNSPTYQQQNPVPIQQQNYPINQQQQNLPLNQQQYAQPIQQDYPLNQQQNYPINNQNPPPNQQQNYPVNQQQYAPPNQQNFPPNQQQNNPINQQNNLSNQQQNYPINQQFQSVNQQAQYINQRQQYHPILQMNGDINQAQPPPPPRYREPPPAKNQDYQSDYGQPIPPIHNRELPPPVLVGQSNNGRQESIAFNYGNRPQGMDHGQPAVFVPVNYQNVQSNGQFKQYQGNYNQQNMVDLSKLEPPKRKIPVIGDPNNPGKELDHIALLSHKIHNDRRFPHRGV